MIAIAGDHSSLELKEEIKALLDEMGETYHDYGTYTTDSCDYPVFGVRAAKAVVSGECDKGIVICGTGIGISLAANKVNGIRCALCGDVYSAEFTRRHNNANMLALGARVVDAARAKEIVNVFLTTPFEGGRHQRRIDLLSAIEEGRDIE